VINADPSGGASGGAAFPDPPTGDPGAITSAGRTLTNAADELEHADGGLQTATGALASDWQGYAAAAYHASSTALASVARGGAETFRECAHAVTGYAAALDQAQTQIKHLKIQYDDAQRRQQAADILSGRLGTALSTAKKPAEVTKLSTQVTNATNQATDAGHEADGYARHATTILEHFKQQASNYEQALNGQRPGPPGGPFGSPFSGTGSPGPGFGAPFANAPGISGPATGVVSGGLDPYSGVIPVGPDPYKSPIPGYPTYYDSRHQNLASPDDLTNLILLAAPLAAGPIKELGPDAARALARALGIGEGGRAAVTDAGDKAANDVGRGLDRLFKDKNGDTQLKPGSSKARREAEGAVQEGQHETRVTVTGQVLDGLGKAGVPIPAGVRDVLTHYLQNRIAYTAQLTAARETLIRVGTPAALKAAGVIERILGKVR
jgi:uncharacterized protein YukE